MLWGGRFRKHLHPKAKNFSSSINFDIRLWRDDILSTRAHALAMKNARILSNDEYEKVRKSLDELEKMLSDGKLPEGDWEDIHTLVEMSLDGEVRGKLRAGRSRNDQVVQDLKLYLARITIEILEQIKELMSTILILSEKFFDSIVPGFTHSKPAQPVLFSHILMSYFWALKRDAERFIEFLSRQDECPSGSGAIAGTGIPIEPEVIAESLGFSRVAKNSIDATSSRDFCLDFIYACLTTMLTLSRISADLMSMENAGYIILPEDFKTGSSMMPQKMNPDILELARGKVGRVLGDFISLVTILKGLTSGYSRDLQEDKERIFDAEDTLKSALSVIGELMKRIELGKLPPEETDLVATDVAEELVMQGFDYHEAHRVVGEAIREGKSLPVKIDYKKSIQRKYTPQSTSPRMVRERINDAKKVLGEFKTWLEEAKKS